MAQQQKLFDSPLASSISSLEVDISSGAGHQFPPSLQCPGLDLDGNGIQAGQAASNTVTSSGGYGSTGEEGEGSQRKFSHGAYGRDGRKQLSGLYSSLRSLLPDTDHTEKLSSPTTVTQALKYISELQKEVDTLEKKKEELTRGNCKPSVVSMRENTDPIVCATGLDDLDIMVQVILLNTMAGSLPMSKCIKVLENQGLRLVSSSTTAFQNRVFYILHLQRTEQTMNKELPVFCDELENAIREKA